MLPSYHFLFYSALIISLSACTPEKIEGDKHPDIPIFPEHTNQKLKIKKLIYKQVTNLGKTNHYIYMSHSDGLQIYDLKFNPYKLITNPMRGYVKGFLTDDESAFSIVFDPAVTRTNKIKKVFQYKAPEFKKEEVSFTDIDEKIPSVLRDEIVKKYKSRIKKASEKPDYNDRDLMRMLVMEESDLRIKKLDKKIEKLISNLSCMQEIASFTYILQYPDNMTVVKMRRLRGHSLVKDIRWCGSNDDLVSKPPESFDKTVMGNSWGGNHFVGGFTPYGYNYINLKLDDKTTKTKVKNAARGDGLSIIFETDDKLILKVSAYDYYMVTRE